MIDLTAVEAVDRLGKRVEDRNNVVFSEMEKLEALDEAVSELYTELRLQGQHYDMDSMTVPIASFTVIQKGVWEYEVPQYVSDVIRIEAQASVGSVPMPIQKAKLDEKDGALHFFASRQPVWHWAKFSNTGRIQLRGNFVTLSNVTIYFMRRWAPMHRAVASGGTLNTLVIGAVTGRLVPLDDLYIGQRIQITADTTTPANVGQRRRILDFDAATSTFTLDADLSGAPDASTQYAMLTPIAPEYVELMLEMAANILLLRVGDLQTARSRYPRLASLRDTFERAIRLRDTSDQRRVHSIRTRI